MDSAARIPLFCIFSHLQLCQMKSFGNRRYIYPSDSHEHPYQCTQDRKSAPRAIALTHVQSSDHLINCAILSHYFTTLAFVVQQSCIDARYIARFNAFALHNGRFRSCEFRRNIFSCAIISATVYNPNQNFSVARIFCRFCSCANCDRSLRIEYESSCS